MLFGTARLCYLAHPFLPHLTSLVRTEETRNDRCMMNENNHAWCHSDSFSNVKNWRSTIHSFHRIGTLHKNIFVLFFGRTEIHAVGALANTRANITIYLAQCQDWKMIIIGKRSLWVPTFIREEQARGNKLGKYPSNDSDCICTF